MGAKPDTLCNLKAGELLDVQKNFVATFNWLKDFCSNLKGQAGVRDENGDEGLGIAVDSSVSDHPVIKLTGTVPKAEASGAATLTLVGNSSANEVVCKTGKITFASASDSNVVITPSADSEGNVTITIGVYYK